MKTNYILYIYEEIQ